MICMKVGTSYCRLSVTRISLITHETITNQKVPTRFLPADLPPIDSVVAVQLALLSNEIVAMATLLPSLSSDEEDNNKLDSDSEGEDDEVNRDFSFGGILVRYAATVWCLVERLGIVAQRTF